MSSSPRIGQTGLPGLLPGFLDKLALARTELTPGLLCGRAQWSRGVISVVHQSPGGTPEVSSEQGASQGRARARFTVAVDDDVEIAVVNK